VHLEHRQRQRHRALGEGGSPDEQIVPQESVLFPEQRFTNATDGTFAQMTVWRMKLDI